MKIYDESLYCQECGKEISVTEYLFNGILCDGCFETEKPFAGDAIEYVGPPDMGMDEYGCLL